MSTFTARGIVIKEAEKGEFDKRLTLLVKGRGKLSVYAKGCRRATSKVMSAAQLFCYSDYVLYDGGTFISLAQADVLESFYAITEDYNRLWCGSYFLELCDKIIMECVQTDDDDYLLLLLKGLTALKQGKFETSLTCAVFELKLMQISGYSVDTEACVSCGVDNELSHFCSEGFLCKSCAVKSQTIVRSVLLSEVALNAIRYIINCEIEKVFSFSLTGSSKEIVCKAARLFLNSHVDFMVRNQPEF